MAEKKSLCEAAGEKLSDKKVLAVLAVAGIAAIAAGAYILHRRKKAGK
jgi:LPXTG-motif cell wall-anchored protein